jgi:L-ascorbate metabolism protein UlaG (beta-lactamase superfamily)
MLDKIHWLGHSSFFIECSEVNIYIDPFKLKEGLPKADIILITHDHFDHCSSEDVKKIHQFDTIIVGPKTIASKLPYPIKTIKPGKIMRLNDVVIDAVYAYNPNKKFHPKSDDYLGYIVNVDNTKIYHAGDTDYIPEMKKIKADICLLPIGGTYTMNAKEASQAANMINPKVAIPMHFGGIVGQKSDAEEFKKLCRVHVKILTQE